MKAGGYHVPHKSDMKLESNRDFRRMTVPTFLMFGSLGYTTLGHTAGLIS